MKGIHQIEVSNRDAKFKFILNRNITIVRGDSGTGKTTLYEMIAAYTRFKNASGVNISCDKNCAALIDIDWKNQLYHTSDSIIFIDEGFEALKSTEFAHIIKNTDNYYVIFCRDSLHNLPYSVEEIYEIKRSGKYHTFNKKYKSTDTHIFGQDTNTIYDSILTEDSKAGYQFFSEYAKSKNIACYSSSSNSSIFNWLMNNRNNNTIVIADGAAFGSEIDKIIKLQKSGYTIKLYLPESFEWLILKSGILKNKNILSILEEPSANIDSLEYFSWEQFFTALLIKVTADTPFKYEKNSINTSYISNRNMLLIIKELNL